MSRPRFRATVLAALAPALVALFALAPSDNKASAVRPLAALLSGRNADRVRK